jgi:uncharacterized protein YcaQ
LLSPFDNLIYDRKRAQVLFGLDYTMEIYVPKAKRRYGYYAMPLLDGDTFVALVDLAVDRARGVLKVLAATPVETAPPTRANAEPVAAALHELAEWTGSSAIEVSGPVPPVWRSALA